MAASIRLFIAIGLPRDVKAAIGEFIHDISGGRRDYKWVAEDNLHITMAFLGNVDYDDIPAVSSAIERAASSCSSFSACLGPIGTFTSVIWVGLSDGDEGCRGIYKQLRGELAEVGFRLDDKRYHPHITIARSRRRMVTEERRWFEENKLPACKPFRVKELILFESHLRPRGPEYIPIQRIPLVE